MLNKKEKREADPFHISYFIPCVMGWDYEPFEILTQPLSDCRRCNIIHTQTRHPPLVINHTVSTASKQNMPHHTSTLHIYNSTTSTSGYGIYRPKAYTRRPVSYSNKSNQIDWKNRRDSGIAKTISSGTLGRVLRIISPELCPD